MSQESEILKALKRGRKITPLDAHIEWDCMRLGGRIGDLRKKGHNILTKMIKLKSGKRIAQYSLKR